MLKNHNQAMAFCQRAAAFSPNDPTPYANAMAYAEFATDVKSDAVMWAANGLLKRDTELAPTRLGTPAAPPS